MEVRAKKALGQHFLTDQKVARAIVDALPGGLPALEVGPGMGVLSQYLLQRDDIDLRLVEIDTESVEYLLTHFPGMEGKLMEADFLRLPLENDVQIGCRHGVQRHEGETVFRGIALRSAARDARDGEAVHRDVSIISSHKAVSESKRVRADICHAAWDCYAVQMIAFMKSALANAGHRVRDRYGAEVCVARKRVTPNAGHAVADDHIA